MQLSTRGCCWAHAGKWPRGIKFIGHYIGNGHEQPAVHFSSPATWSGLRDSWARETATLTCTHKQRQRQCAYRGRAGGSAVIITTDGGEGRVDTGAGLSFSETTLLPVHLQCTSHAMPQEASRKSKDLTGIEQLFLSARSNKNTRLFRSHF